MPVNTETYTCSCGWEKVAVGRCLDLAIKLHNRQNHAGTTVIQSLTENTDFAKNPKKALKETVNKKK